MCVSFVSTSTGTIDFGLRSRTPALSLSIANNILRVSRFNNYFSVFDCPKLLSIFEVRERGRPTGKLKEHKTNNLLLFTTTRCVGSSFFFKLENYFLLITSSVIDFFVIMKHTQRPISP